MDSIIISPITVQNSFNEFRARNTSLSASLSHTLHTFHPDDCVLFSIALSPEITKLTQSSNSILRTFPLLIVILIPFSVLFSLNVSLTIRLIFDHQLIIINFVAMLSMNMR